VTGNRSTEENTPLLFFSLVCVSSWLLIPLLATGQEPDSSAPPVQTVQLSFKPSDAPPPATPQSLGDILKIVLLQAIDDEFVDERNWGRTTERFDGFRIRGTRISKREREVNHGFWQRYRVRLVHPDDTLKIDLQQQPAADGEISFTLRMTLRVRCEATYVFWNYGVKGLNGTAISDATVQVRLVLLSRPQFRFSLDSPLPKFELRPRISQLDLKLKDVDLRRLGVLTGPGVEMLGDGSRKAIEELLQQQTGKLKNQLQKKLDGHEK